MERMCPGWDSRDVSFPRWRGDSKSSPPQVDEGRLGNRSGRWEGGGEEPTKPHRQLQEEFQRTRDLGCGCAHAPIVRCKEAELCPVGAGRWPRGHRLAGSCEPVPGETLVNDPLKGGVPGSAAVRSQSAPAASYLPPALSY